VLRALSATRRGLTTRLVVFDLDGTLIDSRQDLADAANALIVERGGSPLPVDAVTGMVGEGAALLVRRALRAAGLDADLETALPRFLELYDERLLANTRAYPGTVDALDALAVRVTLAVLTNKPQRPTEAILRGLKLHVYFAQVIGGDTNFGRKPDAAGLRHIMASAHASADETVLVGDSAIDLRTARAAGVAICLVKYGFGFPLAVPELSGDEHLVDAPSELVGL
jgi:phosphoglycolate phosphatase